MNAHTVTLAMNGTEFSLETGRMARQASGSVLVGMGDAGLLSRALYPHFGSAWIYAAARQGGENAPGQLCADLIQRWRCRRVPMPRCTRCSAGQR